MYLDTILKKLWFRRINQTDFQISLNLNYFCFIFKETKHKLAFSDYIMDLYNDLFPYNWKQNIKISFQPPKQALVG